MDIRSTSGLKEYDHSVLLIDNLQRKTTERPKTTWRGDIVKHEKQENKIAYKQMYNLRMRHL